MLLKKLNLREIMFKNFKEEIEINGKKIVLETGKIARQADGAIIATCGETVVMATAVGAKKVADGQDYFPLSVNYQENIMQQEKYLEDILNERLDQLKQKHLFQD